jgi:hypothetical protein
MAYGLTVDFFISVELFNTVFIALVISVLCSILLHYAEFFNDLCCILSPHIRT